MSADKSTITKGAIWSVAGLAFMALTGFFASLGIGSHYGPEGLGVFSQITIAYVFLGHLCSLGIHQSLVFDVPLQNDHYEDECRVLASALLAVSLVSFAIFLVAALLFSLTAWRFEFPRSVIWIIFGCPFLALNKVFFGFLYSKFRFRGLALCQIFRSSLYLASLFILSGHLGHESFALSLMLSDCIIFFGCIALKFNSLRIGFSNDVKARVGRHIDFGRKSLLGLFALEINSRVDVIVLSIFFSQYLVGVYSLFALIVDGCQQLLQVARTLLTPVFSKLLRENSAEVKLDFLRKTKRNTFYISIALSPLIFIIYFMIIALLGKEFSAEYSWLCLFMLVASMAICSGATILDFVINQLGEPSKLTAARIKVLFANCSLNLCLVPSLGIYGAALATSVSFFLYAFLINKETCRPLV